MVKTYFSKEGALKLVFKKIVIKIEDFFNKICIKRRQF